MADTRRDIIPQPGEPIPPADEIFQGLMNGATLAHDPRRLTVDEGWVPYARQQAETGGEYGYAIWDVYINDDQHLFSINDVYEGYGEQLAQAFCYAGLLIHRLSHECAAWREKFGTEWAYNPDTDRLDYVE